MTRRQSGLNAGTAVTHEVGNRTRFDPALCDLVRDYCLLGASLGEVAALLDVHPSTIALWRKKYPAFNEAMLAGREIADAAVARSLYRRAIGYEHPDVHIAVVDAQVVQTPTVKRYPPDTAAAFIWLQNRRPDDWRQRRDGDRALSADEIALEAQAAIQQAMSTTGRPE